MLRRLRRSLAAKILAFQVLGLLVVLSAAAVYEYRAIQDNVYREAQRVSDTVAQVVESLIMKDPEILGTDELSRLVQALGNNLPASITQIRVTGAGGKILADLDRAVIGQRAEDADFLHKLDETDDIHQVLERDGARYARSTHVVKGRFDPASGSNLLAAVTVEVDLAFADQQIRRSLYQGVGLFAVLLTGFWAALYLLLLRGIVGSVREIRAVAERFGEGILDARAENPGDDELGDLGRAFNAMAERIERANAATRAEARSREQAQSELATANSNLSRRMAQLED